MSYTLNIPGANNNPSQDQPLMRDNTNAIDSLINVDHVKFNQGVSTGWHKVIHQTIQAVDPVVVAGINQVYAKNYTPDTTGAVTDTQLFMETGNGVISQMSGTLLGNDGYVWIGGILFQWGTATFPVGANTITFKDRVAGAIPFPNNCFIVLATLTSVALVVGSADIEIVTKAPTNFTFRKTGSNANFPGFYWLAIGN